MNHTETLIERLDQLHGKAMYFIVSMALTGVLLVGSSLIAWQSSREQQRLVEAHRHTLRTLAAAAAVRVGSLDMLRGERGYLLTGNVAHLDSYASGRDKLADGLARLELHAKSERERAQVAEIQLVADAYEREVDAIVSISRTNGTEAGREVVRRSGGRDGAAPIAEQVQRLIDAGKVRLQTLTRDVDRATANLLRFVYLMSFAGLCLLVLAGVSAVALRRSYVRERAYRADLRKRAETDELTGVSNRRELLGYLDTRIAEARRTGTPLSFAMFDIDNFKRVNDNYGHGVGDEAIRYVVRTAQRVVRINDRIGRLGGEEFGIVLPKSSQESSAMVCERMRERLREHAFPLGPGQTLQVTISSGVASLTDEDDATSLIARADAALYEAKRCGRDMVKLAA
jgi:diguanylate cyclase (GGDEF)-like protein